MTTDFTIENSAFASLAARFFGWIMRLIRACAALRILRGSFVFTWLTGHMPVTAGALTALLFIVPHAQYNNLISLVMMAALTALLIFGSAAGNCPEIKMPRIGVYAALFGAAALCAAFLSTSFSLSLRFLLFYVTSFLALVLTASILRSRTDVMRFLTPLLCAVTLSGLYAFYQLATGIRVVRSQVDFAANAGMSARVYSFFDNPNNYAEILVLTLPFFLAFFFLAKTFRGKLFAVIGALPAAAAMVATLSRSGWMALAAGIALFFLLTYRWVLPIIAVAVVIAIPLLPDVINRRIMTVFNGQDTSIQYRAKIRLAMMPAIRDYWALGSGLGSDTVLKAVLAHRGGIATVGFAPHVHQTFLQIWFETGILGVCAFIGTLLTFFKRTLGAVIAVPRAKLAGLKRLLSVPKGIMLTVAGIAGITGALIMGFVEYIWFYPRVMLMFWLIFGVTVSAAKAESNEQLTIDN
ncbi:MAG: O-antigen ligase family protein [Oscillospiraceae bacterium]|jgi:O-antigen ligase|nr:O-antigen ligase family protein [Oscillospiraceae bacterium]